jgi:hypothetical protein
MASTDDTYPPFDENQAVFDGLVRYVMTRDGIPENEAIVNLTNLLSSDEVKERHAEKVRNSPATKLVEAQALVRDLQDRIDKLTALLQVAAPPSPPGV